MRYFNLAKIIFIYINTIIAALVKSADNDQTFEGELITQNHNVDNPREAARVESEHPGENNVVVLSPFNGGRVLGAIMVTRGTR